MTRDDAVTEGAGEPEPEGIFGNLPHTRPGSRSPRRAQASTEPPAKRSAASDTQGAARPEPAASKVPGPSDAREKASEPDPMPDPRGLEDVAWAGVAAAAEAATIGVRLANRALEAMRDAVDRR